MDDPEKVRLYNKSCPPLDTLLWDLRRRHAPAGVWRRVLMVALRRMGQRQDSLARITAAEAITIASTGGYHASYPRSWTARTRLRGLQAMAKRRYGRGELTPADSHHPAVLAYRLRHAQSILTPLHRPAVMAAWRHWGAPRFPKDLWTQLGDSPKGDRPYLLVAEANKISVDSLKKTLQRYRKQLRKRGGQQPL